MKIYVYTIDEGNRIVSLSDNWQAFASENQAGESCHPDRIINESLWKFIDGKETRHLYEICIANVRRLQKTVILPFRCDAPNRRRFLEMKIAPLAMQHLEFSSSIIREEPRDSVKLLDVGLPRSDAFVTMCSMCKKVKMPENVWIEVEVAILSLRLFEMEILPAITHGLCPECFRITMDEIERLSHEENSP